MSVGARQVDAERKIFHSGRVQPPFSSEPVPFKSSIDWNFLLMCRGLPTRMFLKHSHWTSLRNQLSRQGSDKKPQQTGALPFCFAGLFGQEVTDKVKEVSAMTGGV